MIKIGLTGNIASGKSTMEKVVADSGYMVLDLDKVSHVLLETTCKDEVLRIFNTTDRNLLSKIVFNDKKELRKLENIIYPKLREYVLNYFESNKTEKAVFISGALIYEAGFSELFDKIIFVDAKKEIRLKRLIKRNSFDEKDALKRIEAQNDDFKNKADFVIENNEDEVVFKKKILEITEKILK